MTSRIPLFRRTATVTALAAALVAGLTACDFFAPQDTLDIEEASVGPSATVGQVFVGNAVLVSGTTVPSQIFESDGSRRGVLVACEPVAAVMVTCGWRASSRISSWPAKPVAPATTTRTRPSMPR